MAGTAIEKRIFDELAHIKEELDEIKKHVKEGYENSESGIFQY